VDCAGLKPGACREGQATAGAARAGAAGKSAKAQKGAERTADAVRNAAARLALRGSTTFAQARAATTPTPESTRRRVISDTAISTANPSGTVTSAGWLNGIGASLGSSP
jgi:hypothetical protein